MIVTGIGQCCWDHLALIDSYPAVDSKKEILEWHEQGGGPVATALPGSSCPRAPGGGCSSSGRAVRRRRRSRAAARSTRSRRCGTQPAEILVEVGVRIVRRLFQLHERRLNLGKRLGGLFGLFLSLPGRDYRLLVARLARFDDGVIEENQGIHEFVAGL